MKHKLSLILTYSFLFIPSLFSQDQQNDLMRESGKIYVVVAVLVLIFAGLIAYLVYLDIKVKKLEKHMQNEEEGV